MHCVSRQKALSNSILFFTIIVLLGFPSVSVGQSLLRDFQQASNFDPVFATARIENEAGKLDAKIASMAYYPSARVSLSQLDNENSDRKTLAITQPIFSYEKWLTLKESDPKMALAGIKLEISQYDLAQRLFKAVSTLVEAREKLSLNINSLKALEAQVLSARRAFELGLGTITDLRDTEVRLAQVKSQSFVIRASKAAAERQYIALVGQSPTVSGYTLNTKPLAIRLSTLQEYMSLAEQRSPAIRSTEIGIELAEISKKKAIASLLPSVNAFVQRSQISGAPSVSNSGVAFRVDLPLQAGSFYKGTAANLELGKAQEQARNTLQQIKLEVERNYSQVEAIQSELLVRAEAIKVSELSLEATEQSFKGGVRTKLDVLNALQALFQARADYASAQLRLGEAYLALLIVSATDTDVALTKINDLIFTE